MRALVGSNARRNIFGVISFWSKSPASGNITEVAQSLRVHIRPLITQSRHTGQSNVPVSSDCGRVLSSTAICSTSSPADSSRVVFVVRDEGVPRGPNIGVINAWSPVAMPLQFRLDPSPSTFHGLAFQGLDHFKIARNRQSGRVLGNRSVLLTDLLFDDGLRSIESVSLCPS